mmetsp:Transcript_55647/g.66907  ORF Transcript_55647/g.66907 Transcript_55647/m.66907 type:complete len:84 (+) Transcript_55647:14-265(+)
MIVCRAMFDVTTLGQLTEKEKSTIFGPFNPSKIKQDKFICWRCCIAKRASFHFPNDGSVTFSYCVFDDEFSQYVLYYDFDLQV